MKVTIKKWGNSASIRIPVAIMQAAKLRVDATVDVREEDGRVVIEPVPEPEKDFDLDVLISGITSDNLHAEIDFGPPAGKETL
ncbi:MAG: AbrB/MazE/SpoVT family DNA-binding domain-containing protein [Gammaproteobacteria bacterium]|nr:AbrB/MazE/SpoVT family DNA-binding domain-containing protein [Gammaproteobacteria bacterium]